VLGNVTFVVFKLVQNFAVNSAHTFDPRRVAIGVYSHGFVTMIVVVKRLNMVRIELVCSPVAQAFVLLVVAVITF